VAGRQVTDARVRRTRHRLRDAIVSPIHEKRYPAIAVKEILERANVGRSAFYAHFLNKDALLASGIEQMLRARAPRALANTLEPFGKALSFSFPVFDYIGGCRHAADAKMGRKGRSILYQHLRRVLRNRIRDDVRQALEAGNALTSASGRAEGR
jgi:AcrR family transcriptional regulator